MRKNYDEDNLEVNPAMFGKMFEKAVAKAKPKLSTFDQSDGDAVFNRFQLNKLKSKPSFLPEKLSNLVSKHRESMNMEEDNIDEIGDQFEEVDDDIEVEHVKSKGGGHSWDMPVSKLITDDEVAYRKDKAKTAKMKQKEKMKSEKVSKVVKKTSDKARTTNSKTVNKEVRDSVKKNADSFKENLRDSENLTCDTSKMDSVTSKEVNIMDDADIPESIVNDNIPAQFTKTNKEPVDAGTKTKAKTVTRTRKKTVKPTVEANSGSDGESEITTRKITRKKRKISESDEDKTFDFAEDQKEGSEEEKKPKEPKVKPAAKKRKTTVSGTELVCICKSCLPLFQLFFNLFFCSFFLLLLHFLGIAVHLPEVLATSFKKLIITCYRKFI